jgi:Xaa-Pro aminopeptidase
MALQLHNQISASFFTKSRELVIEKLEGSMLVVPAYTQMQRGNDAAAAFEQEANFWYLTGINHPDWWLIIDGKRAKSWLVSPDVDDVHALFDGSLSKDHAVLMSGVSDVIDRTKGVSLLRQAARTHQFVYTIDPPAYHDHFGFCMNPAAKDMRDQLDRIFAKVQDFRPKLAEIRAIKRPEEITALQYAIDLTMDAFTLIKSNIEQSQYKYEYQVEADFTHYFRSRGAEGHAYDPIVAGGRNACTLHYGANNDQLKKGSLLLMDIGAKAHGYAADITRTYAIGKPTKRQIAVHSEVEQAQKEIIALLEPGKSVEEYNRDVDRIMKRALIQLNLIRDEQDEAYRAYFPHAISHGLGIDVHDSLGRPKYLQENMVLTVEPGIYIPDEGIGVRIEDDILITANGHRNLSQKLSTAL